MLTQMSTSDSRRIPRRAFLLGGPLALRAAWAQAAGAKITRIDTVYWKNREAAPFWPHWTWVRVHTDSGHIGIGETYPRNAVEAALVHSGVAPALLGRDPRDIDRIWADLYRTFDYQVTGGAEMRALSAVDLALWDLLGKIAQRARLSPDRRPVKPRACASTTPASRTSTTSSPSPRRSCAS